MISSEPNLRPLFLNLPLLGVVLAALLLQLLGGCGSPSEPSQPNVVWVCLDACRPQNMSCYGADRATCPNMDKMASEGVLFENHYTQGTGTPFSVPSYMTGRFFPVACLSDDGWRAKFRVRPDDEWYLPEILAAKGYETVMVHTHSWFGEGCRLHEAFEEVIGLFPDPENNPTKLPYVPFPDLNVEIFRVLERKRDHPLFLYVHTMDTHAPYHLDPPYDQWLDPEYHRWLKEDFPEERKKRPAYQGSSYGFREFSESAKAYLQGLHDGSILLVDDAIGELVKEMEEGGIAENTILVVNADHGDLLGEDGTSTGHPSRTLDEIIRVPLIMKGPGIPKGRRISELSQNADITPTLVDLLGAENRAVDFDGKSLRPLFEREHPEPLHEFAFIKKGRLDDFYQFALATHELKYEYDRRSGEQSLWELPDSAAGRVSVPLEAHADMVAAASRYLQEHLFPLYDEYQELPRDVNAPFIIPLKDSRSTKFSPEEALAAKGTRYEDGRVDNLWYSSKGLLTCVGTREECPPIAIHIHAPDGLFRVQIEVRRPDRPVGGRDGASFRYKGPGDEEQKEFTTGVDSKKSYTFITLGDYEVVDGKITFEIEAGDRDNYFVVRGFRFIPEGDDGDFSESTRENIEERRKRLEALGYL